MNTFSLCSDNKSDVTVVSNQFIDNYMPHASGAFVKVYMYLLRCLSGNLSDKLSLSDIADSLNDTEADILRAIGYWEKYEIISVSRTITNDISSIRINSFNNSHQKESDNDVYDSAPSTNSVSISDYNNLSSQPDEQDTCNNFTASLSSLDENDIAEIEFVSSIAEKYIQRMLTADDEQLIIYLYTKAKFSSELILELYEYCASMNKKSFSYIKAVAESWVKNDVNTIEKAKISIDDFSSTYKAVTKEFGINRALGQAEKDLIDKWIKSYAFDIGIIKEACRRTLLTIQKPDFKYADRILCIWSKNNVRTLTDIKKLDDTHSKSNVQPIRSVIKQAPKKSSNKFNSFSQRDYSMEDFDELEKRLLNR